MDVARPIRRDLERPLKGETPSAEELRHRTEATLLRIRTAIPTRAYASPKKPRKLLVIESLQGMSHDTIPHANVMLEEMGRITGAWTTASSVFTARMKLWLSQAQNTKSPLKSRRCSCGTMSFGSSLRSP